MVFNGSRLATIRIGVVAVTLLCLSLCGDLHGQCTFLIQDTFRLGPRPHGGSGTPRNIVLGESLSGYWPLIPAHVQWSTVNVSGQPTWIWAATSLDPMEVDPLDVSNGTSFANSGHPVALLPFSVPATPFTFSIDVVLGVGQPQPMFVGFTPSAALTDNFQANGALWISLDGLGNYAVYANGSATLITSGNAGYGELNTGWMRLDMTYDPALATVAGHIADTAFGPMSVTVNSAMSHVGFEAHDGFFNDVNNLMVYTGTPVTVTAQGPAISCASSTSVYAIVTNASAPTSVRWLLDGFAMTDGPFGASTISGSSTTTLTITNVSTAIVGSITCLVSNACGSTPSNAILLAIQSAGSADGNGDGLVDGRDIGGLVNALVGGGLPGSSYCAYDMNADGVVDPGDVPPFVDRLLAP